MLLLALRLGLTPAFVTAVTLLERRAGRAAGGALAGLPLTSTPLLLVLALRDGSGFAAATAQTAVWGAAVQGAVCWVYARTVTVAPRGPIGVLACLLVTVGGFVAAVAGLTWALAVWRPSAIAGLATGLSVVVVVMSVVLRWWPRDATTGPAAVGHGAGHLVARCVVAEAMTLTVAEIAPAAGPRLAGFLGTLPVLALTLAVATHREVGPAAVRTALGAIARATPAVAVVLAVLAIGLPRWPIAAAFALAVVAGAVVTALRSRR